MKEFEITDFFLGASLKGGVLKIMPEQKQWTFVATGDYSGHDLSIRCSKKVATAIPGAIILAKFSFVLVQRGY